MIKSLSKYGIEGNFPDLRKGSYKEPITNTLYGKMLKAFPLGWETREKMPRVSFYLMSRDPTQCD